MVQGQEITVEFSQDYICSHCVYKYKQITQPHINLYQIILASNVYVSVVYLSRRVILNSNYI